MIIDLEEIFTVGEDTYLSSISPTSSFGVVFEDNEETGYFYACETDPTLNILDALHIYNAADVTNNDKLSKAQLVWSNDGSICSLLINDYCHALFDFEQRAGYCRKGFPDTNGNWTLIKERTLTNVVIEIIFRRKT